MTVDLDRAVICLECERVRPIGEPCVCGSAAFFPVATWLNRKKEEVPA